MEVFPGNGNGTVGYPSVFNTGDTTIADLNSDGKTELVVLAHLGGYSIAGNDGKGFFRAPRETPVYVPNSIVAADFNKDGKDDVAVVSDAPVSTSRGSVVVLQGSGHEYFNSGKSCPIGMASGVIAAGDVNHDGIIDLVVARSTAYLNANPSPKGSTTDLSVLLGNADGTFKPATNFTVLGAPDGGNRKDFAVLAHENHDGKLDLIGDWGVALGKGDGTFAAPIPLPASLQNIIAMASGDFNGDGVLDLAVAAYTTNGPEILYTLLGSGDGSFTVKSQQQFAGINFNGIAIADMDGDGKPDVVAVAAHELFVMTGNGDGTLGGRFSNPSVLIQGIPDNASLQILVADFNRDGKPDVLILAPTFQYGTGITLVPGLGGGKLSSTPQSYQSTLTHGVVLYLNGDGAPDVAGTTLTGVTRLINTGSKATVTK